MTDTTDFPEMTGHPERGFVWTEPEKRVIAEYAAQCVQADRESRAPAQEALTAAVLELHRAWNAKVEEHQLADHIDLCAGLARLVAARHAPKEQT